MRLLFRKLADKLLYHGTSLARKESIQKEGLVFNKPKVYRKIQEFDTRIYLTSDLEVAQQYAIKTVLHEKKLTPEERKKFGLTKHRNVGIVLRINAKNLERSTDGKTGLGLDPEDPEGADGSWLIYAGKKIPPSLIHTLQEIPLSKVTKEWLKELEFDDAISAALENVDHIKYTAEIIEYSKWGSDLLDGQKQWLWKRQFKKLQSQIAICSSEQKKKYTNFSSLVKAELENKGYVDKN